MHSGSPPLHSQQHSLLQGSPSGLRAPPPPAPSQGFPRASAPVGVFSRGATRISAVWREDPGLLSRPCRKRRPSAREDGPGRSLCLTKSSACGRLWQFTQPRPLSLLQRGLAPRSKGKARAELRPARREGVGSVNVCEYPRPCVDGFTRFL